MLRRSKTKEPIEDSPSNGTKKKKKGKIKVKHVWKGEKSLDLFKKPYYRYFNKLSEAEAYIKKELRCEFGKYFEYSIEED